MSKIIVSKANSYMGHRDCVYALADTGSEIFYSSGGDGMIVKWNLNEPDKGELLAQVPTSVYSLKYLPTENQLVIGQNFEGLQFLDLKENKISKSLKIEDNMFFIEELGDDLLIGLKSGEVIVIQKDPLLIKSRINNSSQSARCITLSKSRKEFAVGHSDNRIRIYDYSKGELIQEFEAHKNSVFTVRYSQDERFLISGGRDAHLKVWETDSNYKEHKSIVAHMFALNDAAFSPNGKHFVTCSMDKSIKVWDYSTFSLIKVIDKSRHAGHGTSVNKLFWSSYNNQLVSCSDDRTISSWDLKFS